MSFGYTASNLNAGHLPNLASPILSSNMAQRVVAMSSIYIKWLAGTHRFDRSPGSWVCVLLHSVQTMPIGNSPILGVELCCRLRLLVPVLRLRLPLPSVFVGGQADREDGKSFMVVLSPDIETVENLGTRVTGDSASHPRSASLLWTMMCAARWVPRWIH